MRWTVFCRVVDNFGDIGVAWRLASDLTRRGEEVRLVVDDASALAWMAPPGDPETATVEVVGWDAAAAGEFDPAAVDALVETFGCGLPERVATALAGAVSPPVWLNLEYLSAEDWVERSHRLPSPQPGGLVRRFWFPGFTERTGGLIRETDLDDRHRRHAPDAWLAGRGLRRDAGERVVSLFFYDAPALPRLLDLLAAAPTLLLATAGEAADQVRRALGPDLRRGALRAVALPRTTQADYDRLLASADLNFVRGEDSFVRAQWAGRPFVWQIYPQADGAHAPKLEAFVERAGLPAAVAALWRGWNGLTTAPIDAMPAERPWRLHALDWRRRLTALPDLSAGLIEFVAAARRQNRGLYGKLFDLPRQTTKARRRR